MATEVKARTRWTTPQIEDFRQWHEELIKRLYSRDESLQLNLRRAREKFLEGLTPKGAE